MENCRLRLNKYSKAYRRRLLSGGELLHRFLQKHGLSWSKFIKQQSSAIDECLEQFVTACHNENESGVNMCGTKHAILFIQVMRPDLKHKLRRTWDTIRAWEESLPSGMRTPLPLALLIAMICQARLVAMEAETGRSKSEKMLRVSALLGLGFFGLLRPGELLNLQRRHVNLPNSLTFALPAITISIIKPKNFRQLGTSQFTTVSQPDVCNWVVWCCSDLQPHEMLWKHSHTEFRRLFKELTAQLEFANCKFTPASLRAGGATCLFDTHMDVGRLRLQGRWASAQSLEHYVQVGKSQQILQQMQERSIEKVQSLLQRGSFLLQLPGFLQTHLPGHHLVVSQPFNCHGQGIIRACRDWACMGEKDEKDHR